MSPEDQQTSSPSQVPNTMPSLVGRLLQGRKFIVNEDTQVKKFDSETISTTSTVFLRNCKNCEYILDGDCTKVMIESCDNLLVRANKKIVTSTLDVWKSKNITLEIKTQIQTIQVDDCEKVDIEYKNLQDFHSVVWTGTRELSVKLLENGEVKYSMTDGLETLSGEQPPSPQTSNSLNPVQYIIRLIDGQLVREKLIRAEKGFPITKRELDEWKVKNNIIDGTQSV